MIQPFLHHHPNIHPSAWVHPDATLIGEVELAAGVTVWPRAVLRGDMGLIQVGEDSNLQDGVIAHVTSGLSTTRIGARVTVGHGAILHGCKVASDCLVGMGSILLDNCELEPFTIVGAGALVPGGRRFPGGVLLLGNPARVARELTPKDLAWIHYSWTHYRETSVQYGPSAHLL